MRFVTCRTGQRTVLALEHGADLLALPEAEAHRLGTDLLTLVRFGLPAMREAAEVLRQHGRALDTAQVQYLPPIPCPPKIICVGLNYLDHTAESNFQQPDYPTLFGRFASSLTGHGQPIVRPRCSTQLDFEGEMVVYIGRGGRHITRAQALDHVIGYSVCNEASVRDFQFRTPQWTVGKNFDDTGATGPAFVSTDDWHFEGPEGPVVVKVTPRMRTSSGDTACVAALQHQGLILQPSFLVGAHLASGELVEALPRYRSIELGIYAVYPSRKQLAPKVRWLVDYLVESFAAPAWPK